MTSIATMALAPPHPETYGAEERLLFVVNDASFFLSHRLPIACAMRDRGVDVHVAALSDDSVAEIVAQGLTFHPLFVDRTGTVPWRDGWMAMQLASIVRRLRPTLMHCVTIKPVCYGGIVAKALRVPGFIAAVTGLGQLLGAADPRMRAARRLVLPLYRAALTHPNNRIIFQNQDDLDAFLRLGLAHARDCVLIRGSGVDAADYSVVREPPDPPIVLLPSRLLWSKGVGEFVAAARCLRNAGFQARFVIAGEPPIHNRDAVPTETLHQWAAEGVVEWWGHQKDIPNVLQSCSIVCLPSYYGEGVPKALIEAAACGRPIVTTDMPGCRDICRQGINGLLVPPRDPAALVAALANLIGSGSDQRRQLGAAGREVFLEQFELSQVVSRTIEVYHSLRVRSSSAGDVALAA